MMATACFIFFCDVWNIIIVSILWSYCMLSTLIFSCLLSPFCLCCQTLLCCRPNLLPKFFQRLPKVVISGVHSISQQFLLLPWMSLLYPVKKWRLARGTVEQCVRPRRLTLLEVTVLKETSARDYSILEEWAAGKEHSFPGTNLSKIFFCFETTLQP